MAQTSKAGKALAILLAAALAIALNLPAIAWGENAAAGGTDVPVPQPSDQPDDGDGSSNEGPDGNPSPGSDQTDGSLMPDGVVPGSNTAPNGLAPSSGQPTADNDVMPLNASDGPQVAQVGDQTFATLAEAVAAVPDGVQTTVRLVGDIVVDGEEVVAIPAGKDVVLDMDGYSITCTEGFSGRPLANEGTLTITGKGTIDTSASPAGGYGAINNKGTLTIENGTFRGATSASGSAVRNTGSSASLVIDDGTFDTATCAVYNEGKAVINGGNFSGTTCSLCGSVWSYTIRNASLASHMVVNGGTFTGVQGAMSASIGYLEINGGTFKSVACATHGTSATFYALYAAGETGKVQCDIHGGHFETEGRVTAVSIGNDNTGGDGGVNEKATATITGGTFVAPAGVPAFIGAKNTGDPLISGGTFTSEVPERFYAPGYTSSETSDGRYQIVPARGMVATAGAGAFATVQEAVDAATGENAAVTLIADAVGSIRIPADKSIVLDLNGNKLTGAVIDGKMQDVVTNDGALTVRDSSGTDAGTIMGGTHDGVDGKGTQGVALVNNGTCTIEGGTIMRGDDGTFGNYTVRNKGTMTIAGGVVTNNSNRSSLIINEDADGTLPFAASLTITGGKIEQRAMAAVKNDSGMLSVTGGTIASDNQAVQNWSMATLSGGTFDGSVYTWRFSPDYDCETVVSDQAVVNGDAWAVNYYGYENAVPRVVVTGGTISGELAKGVGTGSADMVKKEPESPFASIVVTGGTVGTVIPSAFYDTDVYSQVKQDATTDAGKVVPRAYGITYDLAGGAFAQGQEAPATYTYFEEVAIANPVRDGYVFLGWTDGAVLTQPTKDVTIALHSTGDRAYRANWNAVPLPDADVEIQVELPRPSGDGAVSATVPDETLTKAAEHADQALKEIEAGETPKGMSQEDAAAIEALMSQADKEDVTVVVSLKVDVKDEAQVEEAESDAIKDVAAAGEDVSLYLELSVEMTVKVKTSGGTDEKKVELGELSSPVVFEVKVDPALVAGKSVRIVHVHGGVAETITPISVDRETGIVTFAAQKFSTYALLTSSTLTVTFDSGQGTGVAAQQVAFDGKVAKPADPTLSGHVFAGWYTDQACTHAYDFASPVQTSFTLYAKWMPAGNPGGDDPSGQGGNQGEGTSGSGSSGTGTGSGSGSGSGSGHKGSVLVTTGDPLGVPMAALGVVAFAAAVLGAWAVRRHRNG